MLLLFASFLGINIHVFVQSNNIQSCGSPVSYTVKMSFVGPADM